MKVSYLLQNSCIFITLLIWCYIFNYCDGVSLSTWEVYIWDALFSGDITHYYEITMVNARGAPHGVGACSLLSMLPQAIWNLPIYITHIQNNIPIATPWCMFWSKLFLVLCVVLASYFSGKIVYFFTNDLESLYDVFTLCFGSVSMFISVGYAGQDEIIYLTYFIIGIYCYFTRKNIVANFMLSYSVVLCPFMVIPLFIFLITCNKNLIYVLLVCFGGWLVDWIFSHCMLDGEKILTTEKNLNVIFNWFFNRSMFGIGYGTFSIFIVFVILLSFFAYTKYESDKKKLYENSLIYTMITILFPLSLLAWQHVYRYCIPVPLIVICIYLYGFKYKSIKTALVLVIIGDVLRTVYSIFNDYIMQSDSNFLGLEIHSQRSMFYLLKSQFAQLEFLILPISSMFFALCLLQVLYLYFPRNMEIKIGKSVFMYAYSLFPLIFLIIYLLTIYFIQ